MIHYALRCGGGHEFDGWFKDSASFDTQAQHGMLDCPVCADTSVQRALMAPSVRTRAAYEPPAPVLPPAPNETVPTAPGLSEATQLVLPPMPDQMRAMLQKMRAAVEQHAEYVGPDFADTAREIHRGNEPARPIYGEATPDQEEAMQDDGIAFARIPWVPRANG
jgi:hypothetical protein